MATLLCSQPRRLPAEDGLPCMVARSRGPRCNHWRSEGPNEAERVPTPSPDGGAEPSARSANDGRVEVSPMGSHGHRGHLDLEHHHHHCLQRDWVGSAAASNATPCPAPPHPQAPLLRGVGSGSAAHHQHQPATSGSGRGHQLRPAPHRVRVRVEYTVGVRLWRTPIATPCRQAGLAWFSRALALRFLAGRKGSPG